MTGLFKIQVFSHRKIRNEPVSDNQNQCDSNRNNHNAAREGSDIGVLPGYHQSVKTTGKHQCDRNGLFHHIQYGIGNDSTDDFMLCETLPDG